MNNKLCQALLLWLLVLFAATSALAQQVADLDFQPNVAHPMHERSLGPLVLIDEAHHNFHTLDGRYKPFAQVLEHDGYMVGALRSSITGETLQSAAVLVFSNALHERNTKGWTLPTPSAFAGVEIEAVVAYVENGGGLFLIADHMPFPGAAEKLAMRFGVELMNGFVFDYDADNYTLEGPMVFRRSLGEIGDHPVTNGRTDREVVEQVATFTGSALSVPEAAVSILPFTRNQKVLFPEEAWQFGPDTSYKNAAGLSQGIVLTRGKGRVAIFGEAAMFSSQRLGDLPPAGLRHPDAVDNQQLLLNIIHRLAGDL